MSAAAAEDHPLRTTVRPDFDASAAAVRVADLFAGCGGLTLGLAQAAFANGLRVNVVLAIDFEPAASAVYGKNFPSASVETADVSAHFDGDLGSPHTSAEMRVRARTGTVHVLVGGPPCQGHSNLNNRTRRKDPKNALYVRMARAAEVLEPNVVVIENVPSVQHDQGNAVETTRGHLTSMGYTVATETLHLHALGVPQTRKRHVMLAVRGLAIDPRVVLSQLRARGSTSALTLRWAIGDLLHISTPVGYDLPPRASVENQARMHYLDRQGIYDLPNDRRPPCQQDDAHSYKSMYGRLRWDGPAQTITSGFGSIGQGRYMHPEELRALTAHEAARIQGFPDYFDFSPAIKRSDLATIIGNAVPPQLSYAIAESVLPAIGTKLANAADGLERASRFLIPRLECAAAHA